MSAGMSSTNVGDLLHQELLGSFPGSTVDKNSLANAEKMVQSLVQEDSLEEEITTHSSILV